MTTAFLAIASNLPEAAGGTDAYQAARIEVEEALRLDPDRLAFDGMILKQALERARRLLEHTTVAADFCGKVCTISELRRVYEAVWGIRLDPTELPAEGTKHQGVRAWILARSEQQPGRPAELLRLRPARILYPPMLRPDQRGRTIP